LLTVVIPVQVLLFFPSAHVGDAAQGTFLGWLTTVASVVALLMPPLIGTLSDQTTGKFGRRHPYIVAGSVLMVASTPLLVLSSDLIMFLMGLSLLHLGVNTMMPAYQSLVPDRVPERQRGEASGYVGALTILGNMVGLGLAPGSLNLLLWPLGVCFGLGHGAFSSVDWALSIDALPSLKEAGKDLGLWSASATIPAIVAPLLGGIILTITNHFQAIDVGYRVIFLVASFFLIIAAICVLFVREKRPVQKQEAKPPAFPGQTPAP
jgi:MFS family permease